MPKVLTIAASITCLHQGTLVIVPSQSKFTIGGQAAVVQGDLESSTFAGCPWVPPPPANVACVMVQTVTAGASTKLTVGGKAVLLDTASGTTSGLPGPFKWSVQSAGQTKFDSP